MYRLALLFAHDNRSAARIAGATYVLSGITLSCSQFLAYTAAVGLLPWVVFSYIGLMRSPGWYHAIRFSLCFFCLISWSYPLAGVVMSYFVAAFTIVYSVRMWRKGLELGVWVKLASSAVFVLLLSAPLIYQTYHVLDFLPRYRNHIDADFGALAPASLLGFFAPLSSLGKEYPNSTFLFQNVFVGSFAWPLIIGGIFLSRKSKSGSFLWLNLALALLMLWLSLGSAGALKPLANAVIPGLDKIRFPSFYRLFFLVPFCIALAWCLNLVWSKSQTSPKQSSFLKWAFVVQLSIGILLSFFGTNFVQMVQAWFANDLLTQSQKMSTILILGCFILQLALLVWVLMDKNLAVKFHQLALAELLVVCLISSPVYAVSSYSKSDLSGIIFQQREANVRVNNTHATVTDEKGNVFNGLNVYRNQVSSQTQYVGPLSLQGLSILQKSNLSRLDSIPVIFVLQNGFVQAQPVSMTNVGFKGHKFSATVRLDSGAYVYLYQMSYPHWMATVDGSPVSVETAPEGLMRTFVPAGNHVLEFFYNDVWGWRLSILHYSVLLFLCLWLAVIKLKKHV